ncbi:alginate lyase family protein [Geminicoccus roseus]|uniref:alginate lyase family protein n=1 Tax=Geminicoccus roseus TaxID=404900 RepID=UPI001F0AB622|nr:alginate lyase family protein [Geminicoccus roseus]
MLVFDVFVVQSKGAGISGASVTCGEVAAMPQYLNLQPRFDRSDPTHATDDPREVDRQRPLREAIDVPARKIISIADDYRAAPREEKSHLAACLARAIVHSARNHALEGADSPTDQFYRSWIILQVAIAYLKAQPEIDEIEESVEIREWFQRNATALMEFQARGVEVAGRNNHYFWNGIAVLAVGLVIEDEALVDYAREVRDAGLSDISSDGLLALEMQRGHLALHYHIFAAEALAGLMLLHPDPVLPWQSSAIRRLTNAIIESIADLSGGPIASSAEVEQSPPKRLVPLHVLVPFLDVGSPEWEIIQDIIKDVPPHSRYLGGNLQFVLCRPQ